MSKRKRVRRSQLGDYAWWEEPQIGRDELLQRLNPLLIQIRRVDEVVKKIARGEGRVADLVGLEQILIQPFSIAGPGRQTIMLSQPASVHTALSSLSRELHLEVHAVDGQYPCYLLCRVSTAWDSPDTILEELLVSSVRNEFLADSRFVVLLRSGRSRTFLRVSLFRENLRRYLADTKGEVPDEQACDDILETVATLVLAAAWYEDQRLPFTVADVFQLRCFRSALELVGFVLGSDLYQVAAGLQDDGGEVVGFFEHVYDNRPLAGLLRRLEHRGPENLADLETRAREAFLELNRAFSAFLSTRDAICDLERLELYRIVLGSFGNLEEIAQREHWTATMERSVQAIEACSGACIDRVLLSGKEERG